MVKRQLSIKQTLLCLISCQGKFEFVYSYVHKHNLSRDDFFEILWLGKNAMGFGGAFSIVGEITDFQAWDRFLSVDEMKEWTSCNGNSIVGNLVLWENVCLKKPVNKYNQQILLPRLRSMP